MNILFAIPVVAVLVPFIKVACDHYSQPERQKRADWNARQKIVAPPTTGSTAAEKFGKFFGYAFACVLLGVPAILLCGFIGFHTIALFILIWWAITAFKNDIAETVAEKINKK